MSKYWHSCMLDFNALDVLEKTFRLLSFHSKRRLLRRSINIFITYIPNNLILINQNWKYQVSFSFDFRKMFMCTEYVVYYYKCLFSWDLLVFLFVWRWICLKSHSFGFGEFDRMSLNSSLDAEFGFEFQFAECLPWKVTGIACR